MAEDKVWDAVEEAINEGWTVDRFRKECAIAWVDTLKNNLSVAQSAWYKP